MKDHLTDILAYRDNLERDLAAVMEADQGEPFTTADGDEYETPAESLEGFALSCEVWNVLSCEVWDKRPTDDGGHIVEWLLGCGGPTVRLTYDTRWNRGELFHSWGADPRTGEPRERIEVRGEFCEWLAEWFGVTA